MYNDQRRREGREDKAMNNEGNGQRVRREKASFHIRACVTVCRQNFTGKKVHCLL